MNKCHIKFTFKDIRSGQNNITRSLIQTYQQFEEIIKNCLHKYDGKINGFMVENNKYYSIQKYENKIKQKIKSILQKNYHENNQSGIYDFRQSKQNKIQQLWDNKYYSKSLIQPDKESQFRCDIHIDFKYKQQHQKQQISKKLFELKKQIYITNKKIEQKLKYAGDSILNNAKQQKIQTQFIQNQNMIHITIYFLICQPLVRNHYNNQYTPIFKQHIQYSDHYQIIKTQYQKISKSINLSFQKVYLTQNKIKQLITKLKQQNNKTQSNYYVLQIYSELYQNINYQDDIFISMEDDHNIGLENKFYPFNILIQKLNQIPNLICIFLLGQRAQLLQCQCKKDIKSRKQSMASIQSQNKGIKIMDDNKDFEISEEQDNIKRHWHQFNNVPFITLKSYDIQSDKVVVPLILSIFYSNFFDRKLFKKIEKDCIEKLNEKIQKQTYKSPFSNCCCLHLGQNNWSQVTDLIGVPAAHILFNHQQFRSWRVQAINYFSSKHNRQNNLSTKIMNFILNINPSTNNEKPKYIQCTNDHKYKIPLFKIYQNHINKMPKLNQRFQYGKLKGNAIESVDTRKFRPLKVYQIIKEITTNNTIDFLIILGNNRTSKSLLIELAQKYLINRNCRFKFLNKSSQFKECENQQKFVSQILEESKKIENFIIFQNGSKSLIKVTNKIIINLGKIQNKQKSKFQKIVKIVLNKNSQVKQNTLFICSYGSYGQKQTFNYGQLTQRQQKRIKNMQIGNMVDLQMLQYIIKDSQYSINRHETFDIFKRIFLILQKQKKQGNKQQIDFFSLSQNLPQIISIIQTNKQLYAKGSHFQNYTFYKNDYNQQQLIQIQNKYNQFIQSQLQKYKDSKNISLINIKGSDQKLWNALGFLSSFKSGFFICSFNQVLALGKNCKNILKKIKKDKNISISDIHNHLNNNTISNKFYLENYYKFFHHQIHRFLPAKIKYFFNFYFKIYEVLTNKRNLLPKPILKSSKKYIQKQGIFMIDQQAILKRILSKKQKQFISDITTYINQMNQNQILFLFETVLEQHIKCTVEYFNQLYYNINNNSHNNSHNNDNILTQIDKKQQVLYTIWFIVNIYQQNSYIQNDKKVQLFNQIQKIMKRLQLNRKCELIMKYQIESKLQQNYTQILTKPNPPKYQLQQTTHLNIRKLLTTLQYYQYTKRAITSQNLKIKKLLFSLQIQQNKQLIQQQYINNIYNLFINLLSIIYKSIKLLSQFKKQDHDKIKKSQFLLCQLDLVKYLIFLKFEYFNLDHHLIQQPEELKAEHLKNLLINIKNKLAIQSNNNSNINTSNSNSNNNSNNTNNNNSNNNNNNNNNNIIKILLTYLQIKINFHKCTYQDIQDIYKPSQQQQQQQLQLIFYQIQHKLNPKILFKSQNILLFMKASFLKYNQQPYTFVRMGNIISQFMNKQIKNLNINLLFLNLSLFNFKMMKQEKAKVSYMVLSVDCIKEKDDTLFILFQDDIGKQQHKIKADLFIEEYFIEFVQFEVLILFGANSHQFGKMVKKKIPKSCIISFFFPQKQLNLSTFPQLKKTSNEKISTVSPLQITNEFIKIENSQRIMQMIICTIVTFLINAKNKTQTQSNCKQITKNQLEDFVLKSIQISKSVIQKWYQKCQEQAKLIYDVKYVVHHEKTQRILIPNIKDGTLQNLTSRMIAVPNNFRDDSYYENVGRVQTISLIVSKLKDQKQSLIKIKGNVSSGKTQLLKEIGWLCRTRKIFNLGIYFFEDIEAMIQENRQNSLMELVNKDYIGDQYLLFLIENLNEGLIEKDYSFFESFFQKFSKIPASLIFTTIDNQQNQGGITSLFQHNNKDKRKKYSDQGFSTNSMTDVEKIVFTLIKIRNRGDLPYAKIIQQSFPQLAKIQMKQVSYSQKSKGGNKTQKKSSRNNGATNHNSPSIPLSKVYSQFPMQRNSSWSSTKLNLNKSENLSELNYEDSLEESSFVPRQMSYKKSAEEGGSSYGDTELGDETYIFERQLNVNRLVQLCQQYKKSYENEIEFQKSYLNFDVQMTIKKIQLMNKVSIEVVNDLYFQRYQSL